MVFSLLYSKFNILNIIVIIPFIPWQEALSVESAEIASITLIKHLFKKIIKKGKKKKRFNLSVLWYCQSNCLINAISMCAQES